MPAQRYVSPELTHFVGRGLPEEQQYSVLVESILKAGWLKSFPKNDYPSEVLVSHQLAGGGPPIDMTDAVNSNVVCVCDIPLTDLEIHMSKYSRFGLSFLKPFLINKGANPVMYVANNSPALSFDIPGLDYGEGPWTRREVFERNIRLYEDFEFATLWTEPSPFRESQPGQLTIEQRMLHTLQVFFRFSVFSFIKYFDDSTSDEDPANVYMEREWRVLGDVNFTLADIHRVFLPKSYAERFRADLPEYMGQLTFSDDL